LLFNKTRTKEILDKYEIDALIATSTENVTYSSDMKNLEQWTVRGVRGFIILPQDTDPMLILPVSDLDLYADHPSWIKDLRCYGTFYVESSKEGAQLSEVEERLNRFVKETVSEKDALQALVKSIKDKDLDNKKLGLDEKGVTHSFWLELEEALPKATFIEANEIFREIRKVKTKDEIGRIKKACKITEDALRAALSMVEEGTSEVDIAKVFEETEFKKGGRPFFTNVGCGGRSAFAGVRASDYKVKRGDIIRFDAGCVHQYYHSDLAKIAVLGEVDERTRRYWRALVRGYETMTERVMPGVKTSELFNIAVETIRKEGIPHYKRHHCGHGIGMELYDTPLIAPQSNDVLEVGTTLCLETPYYELGFAGLQLEDMIAVTRDGFEYLSDHSYISELTRI